MSSSGKFRDLQCPHNLVIRDKGWPQRQLVCLNHCVILEWSNHDGGLWHSWYNLSYILNDVKQNVKSYSGIYKNKNFSFSGFKPFKFIISLTKQLSIWTRGYYRVSQNTAITLSRPLKIFIFKHSEEIIHIVSYRLLKFLNATLFIPIHILGWYFTNSWNIVQIQIW